MKINRFDVVELNNNNRATILDIKNNKYYVEEVNEKGTSLGNKEITDNEIKKVIFSKNK